MRVSILLVVLCPTFEFSSAQASLGGFVPVGTYSRRSWNGDNEFISSVGNAKVAVYRKEHRQPRPLAVVPLPVPVARPVPRYPPVVKRPPPVKRPYPPTKKGYGPGGVSGRNGGGLLGGLGGGLLSGLLGGK